jgi:hypothetical protein
MEELEDVGIVRLATQVRAEDVVNGGLQHERVVDGDVPNVIDAEPAGLAAAGEGLVHHVVGDEEVGLELWEWTTGQLMNEVSASDKSTYQLNTPAEEGRLEVLILGQLPALDDRHRVNDRQPAVQLSAGHIIVQVL